MTRDARLLFAARAVRMFGYGSLAVILALYLAASGYDVCFRSVPGGHDWPTWRRGLETNLVELFAHL